MNKFRALTVSSAALLSVGALAQDYTSSGSFLSAIQSNYYNDTFSGWAYGSPLGDAGTGGVSEASYTAPGNGTFDWTATSNFGTLWSDTNALSQDAAEQSITFTFSGTGTTTAFGGIFANADDPGVDTQTGTITLAFYNGSTLLHSYTVNTTGGSQLSADSSFYGYIGSSAITSVVMTDNTSNTWNYAANLYQGAAVPAPEPATLAGLGIAGMALIRRRRAR